jgi:ribosomal protein L22
MTPESPQDPQQGKVEEASVPEEAKQAPEETPEQPEPAPDEVVAAEEDEAVAAEEDEVVAAEEDEVVAAEEDEVVAAEEDEAVAVEEDEAVEEEEPVAETKPRRRRRRKAEPAEEPEAVDEEPEDVEEPAPPAPQPARRRDRAVPADERVLVRAQAKYVRTSARKARLVCDHIRGKDVAEARAILAFTPRAAAKAWIKLLDSAVANAEHNHELVGDELRIHSVHADEGPTLKRFRPRAMGRATRIRKRTSHLTITLTPKES